jgi:hypothetical protein
MKPKLYIDDFVGVTNRLETLPLAFAIREKYGHEIILDWPELNDALVIEETRAGKVFFMARLGAKRIRDCSREDFLSLENQKVILRSLEGPDDIISPIYHDVSKKVKIKPHIAKEIKRSFETYKNDIVVGLHIRHGDFQIQSDEIYDPKAWVWPAVPLWWYRNVMSMVKEAVPEVKFFLSSTGDVDEYRSLFEEFDIFTLSQETTYVKRREGNQSKIHPVSDLFALGCCSVVLATPLSGYSHWGANVLGTKADVIIPMSGATQIDSKPGLIDMHGRRLCHWREHGRESTEMTPLTDVCTQLKGLGTPKLTWLDQITVG